LAEGIGEVAPILDFGGAYLDYALTTIFASANANAVFVVVVSFKLVLEFLSLYMGWRWQGDHSYAVNGELDRQRRILFQTHPGTQHQDSS
jgi:hypothetical protein